MIAFDIDGILVSDTHEFEKDIELNIFISGRLEPIFQIPKEIEYCLLTSRKYNNENYQNTKKLVNMLKNKPIEIFQHRSSDEGRYEYKTRIMNEHPEITIFFESEMECINYMIDHGIDSNRLLHWGTFIQNSLWDICIRNGYFQ